MEMSLIDLLILRDGWVKMLQSMTEAEPTCDCCDPDMDVEEVLQRIGSIQAMIRQVEAKSAAMENHAAGTANKIN